MEQKSRSLPLGSSADPLLSNRRWSIAVMAVMLLFLISCQINNIEEIKVEEPFIEDFSVPIGFYDISVDQMIGSLNLTPVDITTVPQGTNLFLAGGQYYKTPNDFDTLVSFEFDLEPTEDYLDNMRYLTFRLNIINSSHASLKIQLYLRGDDVNTVIDSIFRQGPFTVKGGALDAYNKVIPVQVWQHDEAFPVDRITFLSGVTHLDAKVHFGFPQVPLPPVDYQSGDLFWNQMGVRTGLTITADEL